MFGLCAVMSAAVEIDRCTNVSLMPANQFMAASK